MNLRHAVMALSALQVGIVVTATVLFGVSPLGTLVGAASLYVFTFLWGQPD